MNGKIYFSDEDRRKARTTDIAEFLKQNGLKAENRRQIEKDYMC